MVPCFASRITFLLNLKFSRVHFQRIMSTNQNQSSSKLNRRESIKLSAALGAGVWLGTSTASAYTSVQDKINIACIGIGGRGGANLNGVSSQNIVALCDVDEKRGGKGFEKHRKAKRFTDFRKMFDAVENEIDAVVVSTPDHTHFHPCHRALDMGKHLYCEKPMAHNVWEIRTMTELAREKKVATQLGVQRHTIPNMHRVVEHIKAGAIGKVTEVHCWIDSNRGMPKVPTEKPTVPKTLDWDVWVGPAADHGYQPSIAPYGWRFWWDYGTGETGNWGCHILDIPFWALDLKYPTHVSAKGPKVHELTTCKSMESKIKFPAEGDRGPVDLYWYQQKGGPAVLLKHGLSAKGNNTLFIGEKGMLLCGFSQMQLLPREKFAKFESPAKSIPDSPGFYKEWFNAIRGGDPATCNFDYSGPLSETVLLANTAYQAGGEFEWDSASLTAKGNEKAQSLIRTEYRKGWEV